MMQSDFFLNSFKLLKWILNYENICAIIIHLVFANLKRYVDIGLGSFYVQGDQSLQSGCSLVLFKDSIQYVTKDCPDGSKTDGHFLFPGEGIKG